jgi:hypothetical protein
MIDSCSEQRGKVVLLSSLLNLSKPRTIEPNSNAIVVSATPSASGPAPPKKLWNTWATEKERDGAGRGGGGGRGGHHPPGGASTSAGRGDSSSFQQRMQHNHEAQGAQGHQHQQHAAPAGYTPLSLPPCVRLQPPSTSCCADH